MNDVFFTLLIVGPLSLFFGGFLVATQLRALQALPLIDLVFVRYRWVLSLATGVLIGAVFSLAVFLGNEFTIWNVVATLSLCLIASIAYYIGLTFGWRYKAPSTSQTDSSRLPENIIIEDTLNLVKIQIKTRKRWLGFALSLLQLIFLGVVVFPLGGLILATLFQGFLPESLRFMSWVLAGGLTFYLIYKSFQETIEYVFDHEVIEIDSTSVKIEKFGLKFRSRKSFSADNIKHIASWYFLPNPSPLTQRSPITSFIPAFMIWFERGLTRSYSFGRAVDLVDAQNILETVYQRFPQYKPVSSTLSHRPPHSI